MTEIDSPNIAMFSDPYIGERGYLDLLEDTLEYGEKREDRTGVGTIADFGGSLAFDLDKGFPLLTTKKMAWRAIVGELLWFLNGENTIGELRHRTFGTYRTDKKTIWHGNAEDYAERTGQGFGNNTDLGLVYGPLWRGHGSISVDDSGGDQLYAVVNGIISKPHGRRHLINAWDREYSEDPRYTALPPCHILYQFFVNGDGLYCQMYQRSADLFLGVPFNVASTALLTHIVAELTGTTARAIKINFGDLHVYRNHIDAVETQLSRTPYTPPRLKIDTKLRTLGDIKALTATDNPFTLDGYESHPSIKAEMAV